MNKRFYDVLFTGPTKEQQEKMKRNSKLQDDYMAFVYANPGLEQEQYEKKYVELKAEANL